MTCNCHCLCHFVIHIMSPHQMSDQMPQVSKILVFVIVFLFLTKVRLCLFTGMIRCLNGQSLGSLFEGAFIFVFLLVRSYLPIVLIKCLKSSTQSSICSHIYVVLVLQEEFGLCRSQGITGYPRLLLYTGEQDGVHCVLIVYDPVSEGTKRYDGARTEEEMIRFVARFVEDRVSWS